MNTYHDVKQKLIDHMMTLDFDKMCTMDLVNVSHTIKDIHETEKADYVEKLLDKMGNYGPTFGCATTAPEVTDNG